MPGALRTVFRVVPLAAAQRLMRLGSDFGIREIQCGIVGTVFLVAHDPAVVQFDHALAHGVDDLLVVRGHDDGGSRAVDGVQHLHDAERGGRIEVAGGLVGEQDLRMVHICAGDGHTLRLAAGKLLRVVVLLAGEPNGLQHLRHQRFDGGTAGADHFQCERDVLPHRFVVQQLVVLEHKADGAAVMRHLPRRQTAQIVAADVDLTVGGLLLTQQQTQQCGFAGAGSAHQKDEITSFDVETDVVQCGTSALRIDLAHVFQRNQRHRTPPLLPVYLLPVPAEDVLRFRLRRCLPLCPNLSFPILRRPRDAVRDASGCPPR